MPKPGYSALTFKSEYEELMRSLYEKMSQLSRNRIMGLTKAVKQGTSENITTALQNSQLFGLANAATSEMVKLKLAEVHFKLKFILSNYFDLQKRQYEALIDYQKRLFKAGKEIPDPSQSQELSEYHNLEDCYTELRHIIPQLQNATNYIEKVLYQSYPGWFSEVRNTEEVSPGVPFEVKMFPPITSIEGDEPKPLESESAAWVRGFIEEEFFPRLKDCSSTIEELKKSLGSSPLTQSAADSLSEVMSPVLKSLSSTFSKIHTALDVLWKIEYKAEEERK